MLTHTHRPGLYKEAGNRPSTQWGLDQQRAWSLEVISLDTEKLNNFVIFRLMLFSTFRPNSPQSPLQSYFILSSWDCAKVDMLWIEVEKESYQHLDRLDLLLIALLRVRLLSYACFTSATSSF